MIPARVLVLSALGLAAALSACASDPGPGEGHGGRPGLFVSPFGEPFRAQPGEPYPVAAWFAGADIDHDGKLQKTEFTADGARWFARLDTNGDGTISNGEVAAYEAMASQLSGMGPAGASGDPGGSILAQAGLLNVPEPVTTADSDMNQRIMPDEWSRASDRWFTLLDADKDGVLTLAELPHTAMQDGRRNFGTPVQRPHRAPLQPPTVG
ncbi:EF-hand domain protein [soil metagenome]